MIRSGSKSLHLQVMLTMLFGLMVCVTSAVTQGAASSEPSKPHLICPTSNPDECYPRIFQPTDEFQIVRQDQELPKGLHVRLNIWTGQKEAKINVPDESDPSLEGLPVDRAVVMVDHEQHEDQPRVPKGAPDYEPVGRVKKPAHESVAFYDGLQMLKKGVSSSVEAFDDAMEGLEDLSHDLYYGLKIAEDSDAVRALFCLMSNQHVQGTEDGIPRDQQAAAILAGTLQNNPTALKEVTKIWPKLDETECPHAGNGLRASVYSSVAPTNNGDEAALRTAARVKSKVAVINGLIKDKAIRTDFLEQGGMASLLKVLMPEDKEWRGAQRKVGQLVLDNFLDEDMGAVLGQWPKAPKLTDKECKAGDTQGDEGCWDYHVARIAKATMASNGDWSHELVERLAAARKRPSTGDEHKEL